jgi:hypothetical protein
MPGGTRTCGYRAYIRGKRNTQRKPEIGFFPYYSPAIRPRRIRSARYKSEKKILARVHRRDAEGSEKVKIILTGFTGFTGSKNL